MAKPRILLTGGGTGGHVYPLVAIIQALRDKAYIHVIIERGDRHSRQVFESLDVTLHETPAGKLRRYHGRARWYLFHPKNVRDNLRDSFRVVYGYQRCLRLLRHIKPHVVFVKGGYVSLPVGLAAATLHIPIITHDSDVLPGMTNRIVSRWATKIAVGFPREFYGRYPARKLIHVGVPVRAEFHQARGKSTHKPPTILVVGGSQGAHMLNQLVLSIGKKLIGQGRVIHIAGTQEHEAIAGVTREWQRTGNYEVYGFVSKELPRLIKKADIVVTRAGATTLAEFAAAGVPMIIVPNPNLTGGHQLHNGYVLEDSGAALVLGEPQLKEHPELLVETVAELLKDTQKQQWLTSNARSLFPADAAKKLASLLLETVSHP